MGVVSSRQNAADPTATEARRAQVSGDLEQATETLEKVYASYRKLLHEVDAFKTEDEIEILW